MSMRSWVLAISCSFALFFGGSALSQDAELTVYTEDFPPYNYLSEDGEVIGSSTERVRQVLDRAGLTYAIKMVPWSRAVQLAGSERNVLIYTLAKTPERDQHFDWLVPLMRSQYYLFTRAGDTRDVTIEGLKAGTFRVACVTANISCELLFKIGVPEDKLTKLPNQGILDLQMVLAGRADVYFNDRVGHAEQMTQAGYAPSSMREAMAVDYNGGFYLAAGFQLPYDLRQQVKAAYQALMQEGAFTEIRQTSVPLPPASNPRARH